MKDVVERDLLLAKIRLYIQVILVDREISEKEVTIVVRSLLGEAGINGPELVLELIETAADHPGELKDECGKLLKTLTSPEVQAFFLDLLALSFVDTPNPKELVLLTEISKELKIPFESSQTMFHIFQSEFEALSKNGNVLSIGGFQTRADIPFSSFNGKAAFLKLGDKCYFISLNSTDVFVNGDPITNNYYYCEFNASDTVYFDGIHFGFNRDEIEQLFTEKASDKRQTSWIVRQQNSIQLSDSATKESIFKVITHQNTITLEALKSDMSIQISGMEFESPVSFKIFNGETLSVKGLSGTIVLSDIGSRNLFKLPEQDNQVLRLHQLDSSLPKDCTLRLTNDYTKTLITLSGCSQQLLKNGNPIVPPVEVIHDDNLLIGNIFVRIDLKNPESVFHARKIQLTNISMINVSSRYKNSDRNAIENIMLSMNAGDLGAVLGPAGSGKSTLLNTLLGKMKPVVGAVEANQYPLPRGLLTLGNKLGFVPQDDILMEPLTTLENLFYAEKLLFPHANKSRQETEEHLMAILKDVGLAEKAHSVVGSIEKRVLSGGERKRLNIALELVGDPDVLILDEPTSGLSSQDAEEIVALLKRLANQGKIVLMVIHQPSSVIYKMIDKVLILNKGGKLAHFGDAKQALTLFNEVSKEPNSLKDYIECPECHEVNPNLLMKSLKTESADFWKIVSKIEEKFGKDRQNEDLEYGDSVSNLAGPKANVSIIKQTWFQLKRQFICKSRDHSNLFISFLAAPLIGLFSAFVFKYSPKDQAYSMIENEQYPFFLFILVLAAIFLGLASSVSEIIKERAILHRESLKNISIGSYYFSKFSILSLFALLQSILCLIPAHLILQIRPELLVIHIALMTLVSFSGIATGLFFSTFIRSSVAAYNLVPLILIPQIILGGAFLPFENMGEQVYLWQQKDGLQAPPPAQIMPSRWAYEAFVTANWEFHPLRDIDERYESEKRAIYENLNESRGQGKTGFVEKENAIKALNIEYDTIKSTLEKSQNRFIEDLYFDRMRGDFLSPFHATAQGLWQDTRLESLLEKTWLRDVFVLLLYSILLYLFGFFLLLRQLKPGL
ncbi:ATP-binding cassette domain-containing protein [bacterium]|nr:ATP-binding cassette domain-containing protein [bacterium]